MGKKQTAILVSGLAALLILDGCLEGRGHHETTSGPQLNMPTAVTDSAKADGLVDAAERLLTPISFLEASDLVNQALQADSANLRAQFYKHLLQIPLTMRGALGRIDPGLVATGPGIVRQRYEAAVNAANALPPNLRGFLMNGPRDITKEGDAQDLIVQLVGAIADFRAFALAHRDDIFQMRMYFYEFMGRSECRVERYSPTSPAELVGCGSVSSTYLNLSRPDLESVALVAGAYQVMAALLTGHEATGGLAFAKTATDRRWTTEQIFDQLAASNSFRRRGNNRWSDILLVGADAVQAIRYAKTEQMLLCGQYGNPPLHPPLFFGAGVCITDELNDGHNVDGLLSAIELTLQGGTISGSYTNATGSHKQIMVNLRTPFETAHELASYLPKHMDPCSRPASMFDATYAGLLPNGDADSVAGDLWPRSSCP